MNQAVNQSRRSAARTRIVLIFGIALGLSLWVDSTKGATSVSGSVVDGAGRPVEGVEIKLFTRYPDMLHVVQSYEDFQADQGEIAYLKTNKAGKFQTTIEFSLDKLRIAIGKPGYVGFTKSVALAWGKNQPLVIYKSTSCEELKQLGSTREAPVESSLVDIIASNDFDEPILGAQDCDPIAELFRINGSIAPIVRTLLGNRAILARNAKLLSYFAEETDRQLLISQLESRQDLNNEEINSVRRQIAGGLVSPASEKEWKLLESIITCEKRYVDDDDPIDVPVEEAALALSANGSRRAFSILNAKPYYHRPPALESSVELAIRWIQKHPGPVESFSDLNESVRSAARVFNYSGNPSRLRIDKIVKDRLAQKALVHCSVGVGEVYFYQLVFHRAGDKWLLKGIWTAGVAD